MVLQALADAQQRVAHLDAKRSQQFRRSDARQLQELRRIIRAAGKNHFLVGAHFGGTAAPAALDIAHADRALAVEDNFGRMRKRPHMNIRPSHRGTQKRGRRADPQTVFNRALGVGHALLYRAVVIRVARNAERDRTGHERLAERILPVHGGDDKIAVAPAIGLIALADTALQPPEIRQHIRIAPATIAKLRPGIEILALAAVVDVTVDRGGAAQRLAAWRVDAAATGPGTRFLLVGPVDALHVKGFYKTRRQMDVGMPVAGAGFEQADAGTGIFAEPIGEHASGGARAHDHIVECIHHLKILPVCYRGFSFS